MQIRSETLAAADPARIVKRFVRVGGRLVHYRRVGAGPAVVMLHDSPRSSRLHIATMTALSDRFTIYALDTPGYGNSEPLAEPQPTIGQLGQALGETLAVMGLQQAAIYATHTSSKIALDYVTNCSAPPPVLIADGLAIPTGAPDEAFITQYMRPFELDSGGAYIAAEWTRIRDGNRWFPWFDTRLESRLPTPMPSAAWLQDFTLDLFSTGPSYPHAYASAMRYDARAALRAVASPVIVAARADDVLFGALDMIPPDHSAMVSIQRLSPDRAEWLDWLRSTLGHFAVALPPADVALAVAHQGPGYVDLAHGQMLVHRAGRQVKGQRPLLILEAPTTLHASLWQDRLAATRATLVPELPGYGESDPIAGGSLIDYARALAAMLDQIDVACVDVLAIGMAASLALALARDNPLKVGALAFDGPSLGPSTVEENLGRLCPEFPFDPAGSHLHQIWHLLRDGEAHWPWFDQRVEAMRRVAPEFAPEALHRALVGVLKQPAHYGDVALAGLAGARPKLKGFAGSVLLFDLPQDPAYADVAEMAEQFGHACMVVRPVDIATAAPILRDFLADGDNGPV